MYRSNDVVQFDKNYIFIRPFVKVGEPCESVKVFKYYLNETQEDANKVIKFEENGPEKASLDRLIMYSNSIYLSKDEIKSIKQNESQRAQVNSQISISSSQMKNIYQ
jgi:hypothetical protein